MSAFLRRQLTDYVEYHRDPMNCALHVVGIVILFLGAVLPLSLLPVTVFGFQVNLGILLAIPVLIYWILLDIPIGLAIAGAAAILLFTAATIASHASVMVVWAISIVLILIGVAMQIIGHQVYERRQPALMDNPTHLLLGPVFVMAKLFISLGFRRDLAAIIQQGSNSVYQSQGACSKIDDVRSCHGRQRLHWPAFGGNACRERPANARSRCTPSGARRGKCTVHQGLGTRPRIGRSGTRWGQRSLPSCRPAWHVGRA